MLKKWFFLSCIYLLYFSDILAQETVIFGKVIDSGTGDPIPFVNVVFKGTSSGMTTDFDGKFQIKALSILPSDSIVASYIGYKPRSKKIKKDVKQEINFQLEEDVTKLQEVVIKAGENPAFPILRKVIDHKMLNDKRSLSAYEHDTYFKMEIDADNISPQMRERKFMKKIAQVLDSVDRIAGEDGTPILPLYISESISKIYYRSNPNFKKEYIKKTKINGVFGEEYSDILAQIVGPSMQDYDFYSNWINFGKKAIVSPLADGWRMYYDYELLDSAMLDGHYCYRIDFFPKEEQALAFTGSMWITKNEYAIKQIDATMGGSANINFVEKLKIQQEYRKVDNGAWLPVKSRVLIDIGELNKKSAGMLAKFYVSNKNFIINKPQPISFFDRSIEKDEQVGLENNEKEWDTLRHEPLTTTEKSVYHMIDTIKNIPIVRSYVDILKLILNGYYKTGPLFIGPYLGVIAWNNKEGIRLQAGFKTNINFSRKWVLGAQLAYGIKDERFKYQLFAKWILDRKKWTTLIVRVKHDLNRLGLDEDFVQNFPLFLFASRWGRYDRSYYYTEYRALFERELFRGFTQRIALKQHNFVPAYDFNYFSNPNDLSVIASGFKTSEIFLESRYARDEVFVQNDNNRIALEAKKWPVFTLRYTHGFKSEMGDFSYDKVRLNVYKRIKMGPLGNGYLNLTGEKIFGHLPYPLLAVPLGNQSYIYAPINFNMLHFGEVVSDEVISLQYSQNLEGLLLNKIPLLKKLKWRLLATTNILFGDLSPTNRKMIMNSSVTSRKKIEANELSFDNPYLELGYGVENIFKFLRVDFIHRLTYLDVPNSRSFGVFFTVQIQL